MLRTGAMSAPRGPVHLVSMHSYTADYLGEKRPMEIGVLFDEHEGYAEAIADALAAEGFSVALNAPYSGRTGAFVYSIMRHGRQHGVPFIELEVRQDLLADPASIDGVAQRIGRALTVFAPA